MRACPFCNSIQSKYLGLRAGAQYDRCCSCGSIYMQMGREEFNERQARTWDHDGFIRRIELSLGASQPDYSTWTEIEPILPKTGTILEIGPGTGHLMAAAKDTGRSVAGIETSEVNRRHIKQAWGIDAVYQSLEQLPDAERVSTVVMVNVLEHIYDVQPFLGALGRRLPPGGVIFISTCNGDALLPRIVGTMWSMCKQPDHASFPSRSGMREVAQRSGLISDRIWTHELPFETPLGIAVAIRDWKSERKHAGNQTIAVSEPAAESDRRSGRKLVQLADRFQRLDIARPAVSWLGMACAIKALLVRPQLGTEPAR